MPHTISLRKKEFTEAITAAGIPSSYAAARAMGIDRSTVSRVRSGEQEVGPVFIGSTLAVLPMAFDDLFEVVPAPDQK